MEKPVRNRIWELDFLRGIALISMVYFHVIFDMNEFYGYPVSYSSGVNYFIGKMAVILFTLLAGASCYLSSNNIKRAIKILGIAMGITVASYLYNPKYIIVFGVLHFLGTCILLIYPCFRNLHPALLAVLGSGVIALSGPVSAAAPDHNYFFAIGITSPQFVSSDYYPLVPWAGVFFFGMALGKALYAQKRSIFNFSLKENIISAIGRHTLLVYVLHQPIIIAVLELIN